MSAVGPAIRPVERATRELTFEQLCKDFSLSDKIYEALLALKLANLEEFRFYWCAETEIQSFTAGIDGLEDPQLQLARLRRAWHSVRQVGTLREADKARLDAEDLDSLLDADDLRDIKVRFWGL